MSLAVREYIAGSAGGEKDGAARVASAGKVVEDVTGRFDAYAESDGAITEVGG